MRIGLKSIYIVLIFGLFMSLHAESSIDAQIQNIRNAPPKERVAMMNAFKVQLFKMNAEQRNETISHLRASSHLKGHTKEMMHNDMHQKMNTNSYQSDSMQNMRRTGWMNQNQKQRQMHGVDQLMQKQKEMLTQNPTLTKPPETNQQQKEMLTQNPTLTKPPETNQQQKEMLTQNPTLTNSPVTNH